MTDLHRWEAGNDNYLSAALNWLSLRLRRLASIGQAPALVVAPPVPAAEATGGRWRFGRRPAAAAPGAESLALPPPSDTVTEEQIAQAADLMHAAESFEPPPALIILSRRLGLSHFEQEILLLCAAIELDMRMAALCARAQDDGSGQARPYPTFALALSLFDDPAWEALSPERPLRYWRLIEINQPAAQPLTTSALRADERIVNYLKGLNYLDDRLTPLATRLDLSEAKTESQGEAGAEPTNGTTAPLPASQQAIVDRILYTLHGPAQTEHPPLVQLTGSNARSKQLVAYQAARSVGLHLFRLPAELLPAQAAELETIARLWQRETILLPIAMYLDAQEVDSATPSEGQSSLVQRFLARVQGLVFLAAREAWQGLGQEVLILDVARPTPAEQQEAWAAALGPASDDSPALLAGQFNLNLSTIREIAARTLVETPEEESPRDRLWKACLIRTRPRLDLLAQRLDPKATWQDIVLPEADEHLLRQIAAQVGQRSKVYDAWGFRQKMNRGLGISALVAGESGTGKTMAAEVIANDLRLNLYRIDLSAVVSKYIGETEKNLRRLFDAAEDGGAILFFDEADALFGKRSEVKDSHDRYANIEINYLLQRMESYRGLAILATNMKSALDTAFVRRLRFIVNFPFPGPAQRKEIWQRVFPPETPLETLDYARLARLNLTGGSIHNVALNAAFLAAQAGKPVSMPLILEAARIEFRKLERPINEADFRWQEPRTVSSEQ